MGIARYSLTLTDTVARYQNSNSELFRRVCPFRRPYSDTTATKDPIRSSRHHVPQLAARREHQVQKAETFKHNIQAHQPPPQRHENTTHQNLEKKPYLLPHPPSEIRQQILTHAFDVLYDASIFKAMHLKPTSREQVIRLVFFWEAAEFLKRALPGAEKDVEYVRVRWAGSEALAEFVGRELSTYWRDEGFMRDNYFYWSLGRSWGGCGVLRR